MEARAALIDRTLKMVISHPMVKMARERISSLIKAKHAGVEGGAQRVALGFDIYTSENVELTIVPKGFLPVTIPPYLACCGCVSKQGAVRFGGAPHSPFNPLGKNLTSPLETTLSPFHPGASSRRQTPVGRITDTHTTCSISLVV